MGDQQCLQHFRFLRKDLLSVVDVATIGPNSYSTRRNVYPSTRLLATCVLLKRLSTPQRWADLEIMFRIHRNSLRYSRNASTTLSTDSDISSRAPLGQRIQQLELVNGRRKWQGK